MTKGICILPRSPQPRCSLSRDKKLACLTSITSRLDQYICILRTPRRPHCFLSRDEKLACLKSCTSGFLKDIFCKQEMNDLLDELPGRHSHVWKDIEEFNDFILKREKLVELNKAEFYGIFEPDVTVCSFFSDRNNENILADIKAKNEKTKAGKIIIPGTEIELINYSYCPKCGEVYSQKDLSEYYNNPIVPEGMTWRQAKRQLTKVICKFCGESFLPTLLLINNNCPHNNYQFLCRNQILETMEVYFDKNYQLKVLTRKTQNIQKKGKLYSCMNDLDITKLKEEPTLISNFLQYTPAPLMLSFIEGKNIQNEDPVFGFWGTKNQMFPKEPAILRRRWWG
jgi:hypothetical protein